MEKENQYDPGLERQQIGILDQIKVIKEQYLKRGLDLDQYSVINYEPELNYNNFTLDGVTHDESKKDELDHDEMRIRNELKKATLELAEEEGLVHMRDLQIEYWFNKLSDRGKQILSHIISLQQDLLDIYSKIEIETDRKGRLTGRAKSMLRYNMDHISSRLRELYIRMEHGVSPYSDDAENNVLTHLTKSIETLEFEKRKIEIKLHKGLK